MLDLHNNTAATKDLSVRACALQKALTVGVVDRRRQ